LSKIPPFFGGECIELPGKSLFSSMALKMLVDPGGGCLVPGFRACRCSGCGTLLLGDISRLIQGVSMITSQYIQRMALAAVLLVLPLIIYCSEIVGNPNPSIGSADQIKTVTTPVSPAAGGLSEKDEALARRVLADMEKSTRPGS
jgi:hypothetical protein